MKKNIFILLILLRNITSSFAIEIPLAPLGDDLSAIFESIGRDITPILHQNAIAVDTFGEAEIDPVFLPFYLSIPSLSLTTGDGIATVLSNGDTWNFFVEIPSILDSNLEGDTKDYFDLTQRLIAIPIIKVGTGFALPAGFEVHFSGIYIPEIDYSQFSDALGNVKLDVSDIGVKVKKVIFKDKFFRPAFSIGLGYSQSSFVMDYTLGSLTDFMDEGVDVGGVGTLDLSGNFNIATSVQTYSMDFHLSKRMFLFTPFVKLTPNVYFTSYTNSANFDATIAPTEGDDEPSESTLTIDKSVVTSTGVSLMGSAGIEVRLLFLALHLSATADLQHPEFNLGNAIDLDFDDTAMDKISINLGFRIQL